MHTLRQSKLEDFGELFEPKEALEPILAKPVREALLEWLTEVWAENELKELGIGPRRRAIFDGAPGVGKTTLAHHLAARLGLTMLAVRPERIITKWVGETGQLIGALFDLCSAKDDDPVVLFLDEFDSYSRQRRRGEQAADDSRNEEVNTLLQRIEQHDGFLIAATNFGEHVDQAIWRRFDIHITLTLPGQAERERILARYLAPFGLPKRSLAELATAFETASPALIRQFCENLKRQIVVGPLLRRDMAREAVIDRLVASVKPHPDLGRPRLWTLGAKDHAVKSLPWPLPRALNVTEEAELTADDAAAAGSQAARDGKPIVDNPFPFGDARRARFDEGWRKESGSDGLGNEGGEVVVLKPGRRH
ncbi:MAG: ATP-binding protein [Phycisphaeraceae bacterium]